MDQSYAALWTYFAPPLTDDRNCSSEPWRSELGEARNDGYFSKWGGCARAPLPRAERFHGYRTRGIGTKVPVRTPLHYDGTPKA